jgi:single-strand DNA-binding protein
VKPPLHHQPIEKLKPNLFFINVMTSLVNSVTLWGNVGSTPSVRILKNGRKVATLSLTTGERKQSEEGQNSKSITWHKLVFWGPKASIVENHVGKGQRLFVEGKVTERNWLDKKGKEKKQTVVDVQRVFLVNQKNRKETFTKELPF